MLILLRSNTNRLPLDNTPYILYGTLIVTIIGFFSPLIFFLLKLQKDGIDILRAKLIEQERTFKGLFQDFSPDANMLKANVNLIRFRLIKWQNKIDSRLLKPKRQFLRLSISLFLSFAFLELFFFAGHGMFKLDSAYINRYSALIGSVLAFIYSLFVIWQLVRITIKIDAALKEKEGTNVSKPDTPQDTAKNG